MNRKNKLISTFIYSILIFIFSYSAHANDYPNTSVGVLDLNKVLIEAKAAKKAAEKIDEIAKQIEEDLKKSDESIVQEQNKLIEAQSIMAPEAFEIKRKEYDEKFQSYNITRQQKLLSIDKLIEDSRNTILDNLRPILENISEERGITVLLEKGQVLLNAEAMEITDEVIKKLNKELPEIKISFDQ
tara:strand:+ start:74 stop:631 length:558 start_codon:yes stop_codon:yes gene_type:complete